MIQAKVRIVTFVSVPMNLRIVSTLTEPINQKNVMIVTRSKNLDFSMNVSSVRVVRGVCFSITVLPVVIRVSS